MRKELLPKRTSIKPPLKNAGKKKPGDEQDALENTMPLGADFKKVSLEQI